jgi:hypothetical protein
MSRPEVSFWKLVKEHIPGYKERVENMAGEGMPDVSGVYYGCDYWIELKVCDNKAKIVDPSALCRESQLVWHTLRGRQGSLIFVMVKYSFCIMLYRWKKHGEYDIIVRVNKINNGYNWRVLEDTLRIIFNNERRASCQ